MSDTIDRSLVHLSPAASRLGAVFARPKVLAAACVITLAGLGWVYLGFVMGGLAGSLGVLCQPLAGQMFEVNNVVLVALMWCAMTLAMMLPSAGPMIFTYAEIADTAACKGKYVVSPFVLVGGYVAVWIVFATTAALMQATLMRAAWLDASMTSASALLSGVIFVGAGLYQFSALKQICLTLCRQPFQFFFTHWQTTARGVFRLGLKQGVYCLGCCWAMMLVMFAIGVMNVIWMVALGIIMTLEKMTDGPRMTRITGAVFIAIGVAFAVHWLARTI
jgi:predicted metal-binding membrane protein